MVHYFEVQFLNTTLQCASDDAFEHSYVRVRGDDVDGNIIGDVVVVVGNNVFTAMLGVRGSLERLGSPA